MEPLTPNASSQVFEDSNTPKTTLKELKSDFKNLIPGTRIKVGRKLFRAYYQNPKTGGKKKNKKQKQKKKN